MGSDQAQPSSQMHPMSSIFWLGQHLLHRVAQPSSSSSWVGQTLPCCLGTQSCGEVLDKAWWVGELDAFPLKCSKSCNDLFASTCFAIFCWYFKWEATLCEHIYAHVSDCVQNMFSRSKGVFGEIRHTYTHSNSPQQQQQQPQPQPQQQQQQQQQQTTAVLQGAFVWEVSHRMLRVTKQQGLLCRYVLCTIPTFSGEIETDVANTTYKKGEERKPNTPYVINKSILDVWFLCIYCSMHEIHRLAGFASWIILYICGQTICIYMERVWVLVCSFWRFEIAALTEITITKASRTSQAFQAIRCAVGFFKVPFSQCDSGGFCSVSCSYIYIFWALKSHVDIAAPQKTPKIGPSTCSHWCLSHPAPSRTTLFHLGIEQFSSCCFDWGHPVPKHFQSEAKWAPRFNPKFFQTRLKM